jgi:signal peptidase II
MRALLALRGEGVGGDSHLRSLSGCAGRSWQVVSIASRRRAPELWLSAVIVVADQVTKALVRAKLPLYDSVNVIPGMLDITHATNSGAAFGILNGVEFPYKATIMVLVALIALAAVGLYAISLPAEQRVARVGLALILGGACGNLIDRALAGHVLDFVDVYWRDYHFWAFNVADSAITVGVALMLLDVLGVGRAPKTV